MWGKYFSQNYEFLWSSRTKFPNPQQCPIALPAQLLLAQFHPILGGEHTVGTRIEVNPSFSRVPLCPLDFRVSSGMPVARVPLRPLLVVGHMGLLIVTAAERSRERCHCLMRWHCFKAAVAHGQGYPCVLCLFVSCWAGKGLATSRPVLLAKT